MRGVISDARVAGNDGASFPSVVCGRLNSARPFLRRVFRESEGPGRSLSGRGPSAYQTRSTRVSNIRALFRSAAARPQGRLQRRGGGEPLTRTFSCAKRVAFPHTLSAFQQTEGPVTPRAENPRPAPRGGERKRNQAPYRGIRCEWRRRPAPG